MSKNKKVALPPVKKSTTRTSKKLPDTFGIKAEIPMQNLQGKSLFVATPMYGGMCTGQYTRCLAALTEACKQFDINLNIHFLSNESLIQRGRNYCADTFMRARIGPEPKQPVDEKGNPLLDENGKPVEVIDNRPYFTHMLFIDSDIGFEPKDVFLMLALAEPGSDKDVICGPYAKKCLPSTAKIQTEDGIKTISWIVKNKYTGKVLTLNEKTKVLEWNKVIDYSEIPNWSKKQWVSLQTSKLKKRSEVLTTFDHEIAYIDDVLNPEQIKYCAANEMLGKYLIKKTRKADKNNINPLLNKEQLSILIGAILGDGCVSSGQYGCTHGSKQEEYCKFKANILGGKVNRTFNGFSHQFTNAQTKRLSELIYVNGIKTIKNVISLIDEKSLAIMYMDDGNRHYYPEKIPEITSDTSWWYEANTLTTVRSKIKPSNDFVRGRKPDTYRPTSSIATHSFSYEDNLLLVEHIKNAFDIDSYIGKQKGKTELQYYIKFDKDNTDKLHKLIAPYIPECMEYKINENFRGKEKHNIDNIPLNFACKKVIAIDNYDDKNNSHLYDISIENNHNFFANGTLVHNCIAWEKIKVAVEKGYAEHDPNALERFVGDYVFNPKNQGEINLVQPAEILEGGTGFMMIQRQAFEKFKAKYPNQSYKPDHVRTKDFDGSREIVAYFDCIIDRGYYFDEVHELITELANSDDLNKSKEKAIALLEKEKNASKRYLSEDYMFCQYLRAAGGKIWLLPWVKLQHTGSYTFGGSLIDLAQLGVAATADPSALKHKR